MLKPNGKLKNTGKKTKKAKNNKGGEGTSAGRHMSGAKINEAEEWLQQHYIPDEHEVDAIRHPTFPVNKYRRHGENYWLDNRGADYEDSIPVDWSNKGERRAWAADGNTLVPKQDGGMIPSKENIARMGKIKRSTPRGY